MDGYVATRNQKAQRAAADVKILFLCVANSARSQMAEGLARRHFGEEAEVRSAGSQPGREVHPRAVEAMKEVGIDISAHRPASLHELPPAFLTDLDYVVTLCAEELCPIVASPKAKRLHWPIPDPAAVAAGPKQIGAFLEARDRIDANLRAFRNIKARR